MKNLLKQITKWLLWVKCLLGKRQGGDIRIEVCGEVIVNTHYLTVQERNELIKSCKSQYANQKIEIYITPYEQQKKGFSILLAGRGVDDIIFPHIDNSRTQDVGIEPSSAHRTPGPFSTPES